MEIKTRISLHVKIDRWWNYRVKLDSTEWPQNGPAPSVDHPMYQWCKQAFNSEDYWFDRFTGTLFFVNESDLSLFVLTWK